jgi:hypothetical protein
MLTLKRNDPMISIVIIFAPVILGCAIGFLLGLGKPKPKLNPTPTRIEPTL